MTEVVAAERGESTARGTLMVILAACGFGSISTLALVATRHGTPLITVLALRYLIAGAMLMTVAGGPRSVMLPRGRAIRMLLLGGGGQAVVAFSSLAALDYISAATLGFLFYTYPAWVTVIAAVRGDDRLTASRLAALTLSLGGIAMMVGAPGATALNPIGVALALGSAFIYALYVPLINRLQAGTSGPVAATYMAGGAGLVFAVAALARGTGVAALGAPGWGAVLTLSLLCTTVAFLAFLRGLAILGPVRGAILSTVEPFWTAVLGYVALGQPLTRATIAGGAMIATAVIVLQWRPSAATVVADGESAR